MILAKGIESLNQSISLISSQGAVTVEGDLFSANKGIGIIAANNITTQKINSLNGVVGLSSYQGNIFVENDITTVKGGVIIAAKEDINLVNLSTGVGEVSIGSGSGDIVVTGDISTNDVGYVNIKTNGDIDLKDVTTNKGYIEIAAGGSVTTQSLATGSGVINIASASDEVAINGSIDTDGSYVYIQADEEIATNSIETNGGGVELISLLNNGDEGVLVASEGNVDLSPIGIDDPDNLSPEQIEVIKDFVEELRYRTRPLGDFIAGSVAQLVATQGEDVRLLLKLLFPSLVKKNFNDLETWLDSQSQAFQLGRNLGNGLAIVTGILEFAAGTGAQVGGGTLCITGIGCLGGAPAIATGIALQAHSIGVIKNATDDLGESFGEDFRDLLSPNRMESSGGADDIVGLSKETGISQQGISNAVETISPGNIRQLDDKLGTNLVESLFGKGKELIANVSKTLNLVGDDLDAIDSIKGILSKSKKGKIEDAQINEAFSNTIDFYESYPNRVSGDFPGRFADAKGKKGALQAQNEITTAENLLDGNTPLGDIDNVHGILQNKSNDGIPTPDFRVTDTNGNSRLFEVKTPNGKLIENNLQQNLNKAIQQISSSVESYNKGGYILIDYSSKPPTNISRPRLEQYTKQLITDAKGANTIEFVEILYKNDAGEARLFFQIQNGIIKIIN